MHSYHNIVSSVDMIEVLLSIISLMLGFLLKIDDAFLGGSVLGVLGLILSDRDLTSFQQVTLTVEFMSNPIHFQ